MPFVALLINVLVGTFFLLSAWLKLYPIEFFEAKISAFGISGVLNSVAARVLIGVEFGIGFFLLLQYTFGRKLQLTTLVLLALFVIVNLVDYFQHGNDTNCGCMGMGISISPLMSVGKNILLIALMFVSYKYTKHQLNFHSITINIALILIPLSVVFIWRPVYVYDYPEMPMKGKTLDFSVMMHHQGLKGKTFDDDLAKGKKIVAFLSITCPHCKMAGFKLSQYKTQNPELPIFIVINGDSVDMPEFFRVTGTSKMEMAHFNGKEDFTNLSGYNLPSIYLLNNGVVETQLNNGNLEKATLINWFEK